MSDELSPELATRAELAFARIAEDPGLTGDLLDAEARILLRWAQREVNRLVTQTVGLDEGAAMEVLDVALGQLRKALRQTARLSAAAANPAQKLQELLAREDNDGAPAPIPTCAVKSVPDISAAPADPMPVAAPETTVQHDTPKRSFFARLFRKRGRE